MKQYYINLDNDTESRLLAEQEFEKAGLSPQRIPGVVDENRVLGFNKAVYNAFLSAAQINPLIATETGIKNDITYHDLLLFEDDVVFDNFPEWLRTDIYNIYATDPKDFMTIHLGANIIGSDLTKWQMPTKYNRHLSRLHNCYQSHATLYSAECVEYVICNFKYHQDEYRKEGIRIFDDWLRTEVLSQGRSYVLNPMVAYQRPRVSAIWGVEADYTGAHKQGNQYLQTL